MMPHPDTAVPYSLTAKAEAYLAQPEPEPEASQDERGTGS